MDVCQITTLVTLNLSNNRIAILPYDLCMSFLIAVSNIANINDVDHLQALTDLNLGNNSVRALPASVAFMASLETLSLSGNKLTIS